MLDYDNQADGRLSGPVVDRRTTVKLLTAAGLSGLAGCTGTEEGDGDGDGDGGDGGGDGGDSGDGMDDETETPTEAKRGGRLQAAWTIGSIETLDPPFISVGQYFQLAANVFNGLTTLEQDLTVRGDLAKDWTVENDGRQFTFELREGVTFHNGDEFTAEDVRYTIDRTISEDAPAAAKLESLQPVDEGGVEVIDDYTVQLNWEAPNAVALIYLTRGPGRAATIVNQTAIEEMGREQYAVTPVGTGPFEVTDHDVGSSVTLDAFDDYFETDEDGNQLPYLDGVDVQNIPEPSTVVNAIRSGDAQFVNVVPLENVDQIEESGEASVSVAPGINWLGLTMNNAREPFDSRETRQGIAKLIDNEAYVETAYFGNATPNAGILSKAYDWVWREEHGDDGIGGELKAPDQVYDPEGGQQLLEEAGADGASISILANEGGLREARAMRQQLNSAGLDVDIDQVTNATYWERFQNEDYDVTISGSIIDPDPEQALWNFYRLPDGGGVWNWQSFESQTIHDLLEDQRRALDRDQRKEILWEIEDHLIKEAPHAYLSHRDDIAALRGSVNGFTHIPGMRSIHTVWLDE